uniref:Thioredoxin-like protein 1 n=1 Tax=Cyanistes caeruleus TaxID=156563 RepID=A0A8C0U2H9_CYACU
MLIVFFSQGTAATNNISATPTFLFFRNKVRIDQYQGADAVGLEDKIKQHLENDPGNSEDTDIPKGYMDLLPFINKAGCECLNESDEHGFENCLRKDSSYLESDCDEQVCSTGLASTVPGQLSPCCCQTKAQKVCHGGKQHIPSLLSSLLPGSWAELLPGEEPGCNCDFSSLLSPFPASRGGVLV